MKLGIEAIADDLSKSFGSCWGIAPEDCIVIEDSPNGIRSGFMAGMEVLGVRHEENIDLDLSLSKHVFDSLNGVREYLEKRLNGLV